MAAWWYQRHVPSHRPPDQAAQVLPLRSEPQPSAEAPRLIIPVAGVRAGQLVDTFSQARASGRRHDAIDIMAPRGTPVIAAAAGKVEKLFLSKDGGNTVYVRSPDGRRLYYYAHLDGYAPGLGEGVTLRQGAPIGSVGSTGNANPAAPHLHFAIWMTTPERKWWEDAIAINPFPLLKRD
ncbi:MAG: M23 family metallopeptidase [Sphingomonadales bacterium]|nr:M23 family metallopeptidase [Sphingomonadales bacterium]